MNQNSSGDMRWDEDSLQYETDFGSEAGYEYFPDDTGSLNYDYASTLDDYDPYEPEPVKSGKKTAGKKKTVSQKKKKATGKRKKKNSSSGVVIWAAVVFALAAALALAIWIAADDVLSLTKTDRVVQITVNEDDTIEDLAQNLKENGLINYPWLFKLYGKFSNAEEKISPGTYELNQLFDYHAIVNGLTGASETRMTVTLTFPEGYSTDQVFDMLEENGVCSRDDLEETAAEYAFDYDFLADLPYGEYNRLEGYLFPDTYEFYVGDEPVRVLNKFLNNFDSKFTEDMRDAIVLLNADIRARMETEGSYSDEEIEDAMMDMYDVLTVASLIEKEAGVDSERDKISSVIYNRLTTRVHELLQIDATVEYALGEHKTVLTANDLSVDNPYNTYKYKGLPPGPIANPGISSIMAALYPEESDYFFYALNTTGAHSFFRTYAEQQAFLNGETDEETLTDEDTDEDTEEQSDDTADEDEIISEPEEEETDAQ